MWLPNQVLNQSAHKIKTYGIKFIVFNQEKVKELKLIMQTLKNTFRDMICSERDVLHTTWI